MSKVVTAAMRELQKEKDQVKKQRDEALKLCRVYRKQIHQLEVEKASLREKIERWEFWHATLKDDVDEIVEDTNKLDEGLHRVIAIGVGLLIAGIALIIFLGFDPLNLTP